MKSEEKETRKSWSHDWITTGSVQSEDLLEQYNELELQAWKRSNHHFNWRRAKKQLTWNSPYNPNRLEQTKTPKPATTLISLFMDRFLLAQGNKNQDANLRKYPDQQKQQWNYNNIHCDALHFSRPPSSRGIFFWRSYHHGVAQNAYHIGRPPSSSPAFIQPSYRLEPKPLAFPRCSSTETTSSSHLSWITQLLSIICVTLNWKFKTVQVPTSTKESNQYNCIQAKPFTRRCSAIQKINSMKIS